MIIKGMGYVQIQVTEALLRLLSKKPYGKITVSDIVAEAGIGRASFYRNYIDKDDVIRKQLRRLILLWHKKAEAELPTNWQLSLMEHYYENRDFYLPINQAGLSYMQLENILSLAGPKETDSNLEAYFHSLLAYSVFGWIIEWMNRGMQESPKQLSVMMDSLNGNK